MRPVRIAVEGLYATEGTTDGAGRFLTSLLAALGRRDDVEVVAIVGPSTYDAVREIDGLREVVRLGPASRAGRIAAQHAGVPREARRRGADVLLCLGNYAPLVHALPTVAVVQNLLLAVVMNEYGRARAVYRRLSARHLARHSDAVVSISELMARELVRTTPRAAERVRVVYPGVDVDFFGTPAGPPAGAPDPYLLAVGTVWAYRDYPLALEALGRSGLPHTLAVAGAAAADERERLEHRVAELGLEGRLHLLGAVPPDELRRWYARADALLATSRLESFGLSVLEAMAAGTPVVAVDRSVYPETARGAAELAPPEPDALAAALQRALEPERRAELVALGRERAAGFTWDRSAEGLVEVCRSVAG